MLGLVNDLLDAAKISAGKFEVNKSPESIKDLIKKRIDFYTSSANKAKIKLVQEIDLGMPEQIKIDSFRMSQVLNNLISNAIKFTPAGGEVRVQAFMHKKDANLNEELEKAGIKWHVDSEKNNLKLDKDCLIMGVTDTGIGLAKENIPLLFNKFKQFTSKAISGEKGTGLGLAIAKGIVEAHGGVIGVDSTEGSGTTFYFSISEVL
jgi:signal transduction histidine kinase